MLLEHHLFELAQCSSCGFVFKNGVRVNYLELGAEYYSAYNFDRSKEIREVVKALAEVRPIVHGLNVMEIGCGTGAVLNELRKYGFNVSGYEPSEIAASIARQQFGLQTVFNGFFSHLEDEIRPDIFLLYDVAEHLSPDNLLELLGNVSASMEKDSLLVIRSGDAASWNANLCLKKWSYIRTEQHISFFTRKSLTVLCRRSGLKVTSFKKFKHAYGGLHLSGLLKNLIRAFLNNRFESFRSRDRFYTELANDHFIAIVCKI